MDMVGFATPMESLDKDRVLADLFGEQASSLVRLARFFVHNQEAAEDLVQEAFLRLVPALDRIRRPERTVAYLRSIVLNLARDHNRRGLVSLRHRPPERRPGTSPEDRVVLREDQQMVIDSLASLPRRQRNCLTLKYYLELTVPEIADTLGVSVNSVKTHLRRGMRTLEARLEARS